MTVARMRAGDLERIIELERDVPVDYHRLADYCWSPLAQHHADLLNVAGVVALADRAVVRAPARDGWARDIHLELPVVDPVLWSGRVRDALVECLAFVSGDRWSFDFVERPRDYFQVPMAMFDRPDIEAVIPFSGGLDSFLLWRDLRSNGQYPLLVNARTSSLVRRAAEDASLAPPGPRPVVAALPVRPRAGVHAEATFRTRTFLFGCAAGIAAQLSSVSRVLIAENGQGSIGASLVPFGGEVPYRTTHPLFTKRMERLFAALDLRARFEHPYVWRTKGAVLRELIDRRATEGWQETTSCTRNLRRTKQVTDDRACGICGNCVLRRVAVHAAGAHDAVTYHWGFDGQDLADAEMPGAGKATTKTDRAIAARSIMAMDAFARLDDDDPGARRSAFAMGSEIGIPVDAVLEQQRSLRTQHASEWNAFLSGLPRQSWARRYVYSDHDDA